VPAGNAGPFDTITAARAERDSILGAKGKGDQVLPSPRLRFGDAADRWLAEQVAELRPATRAIYRNAVENHLRPRWGGRRMDGIDVADVAKLVRELRAERLAEWTIVGVLKVANRVFKFARRHCGWRGENPVDLLEKGERPRPSDAPERRIYEREELAQTLAASSEPWTTLFQLAAVVGGRRERAARALVGEPRSQRSRQGDDHVQPPGRPPWKPDAAEDGGVEGNATAAACDRTDALGAQGALRAHGTARIRLRVEVRPGAQPAQRSPCAVSRSGTRTRRERPTHVPRAVRARPRR
jgi:hypothetical protein